ncbi:MAG: hypothetical protein ABI840_09285 [bacterium]
MNPVYYIIILLTLISYKITDMKILTPDLLTRSEVQINILSGQADYPYQYRVLKPLLGYTLQKVINNFVRGSLRSHLYAFQIITLIAFFLFYFCFYKFLSMFFSDNSCIIGLMLLQVVIPLSITSIWQEGDFYNFIFFTIGFLLMFKSKDYYLPLVFGIGMLNREQIIFLMVFYIAFLLSQNKLNSKKSYIVICLSVLACAIVYFALRWKYGFKSTEFNYNASRNIENIWNIIQLWSAEVLIFVMLSLKTFKSSNKFFKLGLIALGLYFILYFFYGYMGELAKFLPAYLILIPMSLQVLTREPARNETEIFSHIS